MKLLKKLLWYWKLLWGRRYFITIIEEGLKEDEILVSGHRVYLTKNCILHKKTQKDDI